MTKLSNTFNWTPYGMVMPDKHGSAGSGYRYGFQGQEKDDEVKGQPGNSINYKYRMHDPRVGRFFAVDPLTSEYPWYTPYQFSGNMVIAWGELEGLENYYAADGSFLGQIGSDSEIRVVNLEDVESFNGKFDAFNVAVDKGWEEAAEHAADLAKGESTSLADYIVEVDDVTNNADLETYSKHKDCKKAADAQMKKEGLKQTGSANAIHMLNPSTSKENRFGAIIYAVTELKNGNPVEVGILTATFEGMYASQGNTNDYTTHFLVLNSIKINGSVVQIEYLDNSRTATGRRPNENLFTLDLDKGTLVDNSNTPMENDLYQVTEVRKSKPVPVDSD